MKNELGIGSVKKLLVKQSVPSIIGLLVLSLYNLVDTIFIGWGVGPMGIAGVAIAFPISMISMAIAQTFGIGAASIISRALGSNDYSKAKSALGNFFTMSIITGIILTILGFLFLTPLLKLFGATKTIMPFAYEYLFVLLFGTVFIIFAAGSNSVIRSEGRAKYAMVIMASSALVNVILDPILIFGFDMGLKGAAWATVIAQIVSAIIASYYFISGTSTIKVKIKDFILQTKIVFEMFAIGASSFGRMIAGSVMAMITNNSLGYYGGDMAIAAFGVVNRLLMFILMPMFGIVQGLQPVLGFNYGANKFKRAKESIILATKWTTIMCSVSFVILLIFAELFMKMFTNNVELITLGARATRMVILVLPIIGFQIIAAGMYQAMGKALKAFIFSILRQVIFIIPILLILPTYLGLDGIWLTFAIADVFAGIVTWHYYKKDLKALHSKKED